MKSCANSDGVVTLNGHADLQALFKSTRLAPVPVVGSQRAVVAKEAAVLLFSQGTAFEEALISEKNKPGKILAICIGIYSLYTLRK